MQQFIVRGALAAACLLSLAPASAHVSLETQRASAGASYKAVFRVPHGCDGSPTLKVNVKIPDGVIAVKPMPKAGWQMQVSKGPYGRTYDYHGKPLAEGVKEVTWTGTLADEHYDEFVLVGSLAQDLAGTEKLYFPVTQTCQSGTAAWTQVPQAGQDAKSLKRPAPALTLVAQQGGDLSAAAKTFRLGDLTIEAPWARATPGGAKVAGGYLKITNAGKEPDRLTGGAFALAGKVEVHEMAMSDGVMRMRQLASGLEIKPGETVELKPGGLHMMFMDLKQGLKQGETQKITLTFEKAGSVEVEFRVAPIGASGPDAAAGSRSGGGGHSHH